MIGGSGGPRPRLTPRGGALLLAGAIAVLLALLLRDVALLFLSVPLFAGPIAAIAGAPPAGSRAQLTWTSSGSGPSVDVDGTLRLSPGLDAGGLDLRTELPVPLRARSPPRWEREPGEVRVHLSYVSKYPCLAILPLPRVLWRDPLGLVERAIPVEGSALQLERFPPELARLKATRLRRTTVFPGEVLSRHRGGSGDFFAIRPSVPGDTPRQINWAASARAGRWLANEYLMERTGDLLIVLDLRPTSLGATHDAELLSMARSAAFGIASAFLAEKARVGLATFAEYAEVLPLGSGRLQRFRLRRLLEATRVGEAAGPPERLGVSLSRHFPKGLGTLVISSLSDEDGPLLLAHLRRRGFAPFVLAPSPVTLLTGSLAPQRRSEQLALRLLRLARRERLAAAWKEAPVIEWEDYWSLAPLVRFLGRPAPGPGATA